MLERGHRAPGVGLDERAQGDEAHDQQHERDEHRGHLAFRGDRFRCGGRDQNERVEGARPRRDAPHRRIADQARAQRRDARQDGDEQGKAVDDEPSVPHRDRHPGAHTAEAEEHQSACGE